MNSVYIDNEGGVVVHDADERMIDVISRFDPQFKIAAVGHPPGYVPEYRRAKDECIGLTREDLYDLTIAQVHDLIVSHRHRLPGRGDNRLSLLDSIQDWAFRLMTACRLCHHQCGVNRFERVGKCGLRHTAHLCEVFRHIAEEAPINPALVVNLAGCGMDCVYCISHGFRDSRRFPVLDIASLRPVLVRLTGSDPRANSLEFGCGSLESLPWCLALLNNLPEDFTLPLVFNCHLYMDAEVVAVLNRVVDIWLPDLRYFSNDCAERLSDAPDYVETATKALTTMAGSDARIVVRILVLPNHHRCCQEPALRFLSQFKERFWVSILGQYVPERDAHRFPDINRRATGDEVKAVEDLAAAYGLRDVNKNPEKFWQSSAPVV
jgi:putative pyruvate formate lyase activating enzyme